MSRCPADLHLDAYDAHRDRPALDRLCTVVGRVPPRADVIPAGARVMRQDGRLVAFGMIFTARRCGLGYLDWLLFDPGLDPDVRRHAVVNLVADLTEQGRSAGATTICASFHDPADRNVAIAQLGYLTGETGVDILTAEVDPATHDDNRPSDEPPAFDRFTGGTFSPDTQVVLADGRAIPLTELDAGDRLRHGGVVTAVAEMNLTHTYRYHDVVCAGENLVWTASGWQRVRTLPDAVTRPRDHAERMIAVACRGHRIMAGGLLFADYLENDAIEDAIADSEDATIAALNAVPADS